MGGFPWFGEGGGTGKKNCLSRLSKKISPKCMFLGTSDVIWNNLGTVWSDFRMHIAESHFVIKRIV